MATDFRDEIKAVNGLNRRGMDHADRVRQVAKLSVDELFSLMKPTGVPIDRRAGDDARDGTALLASLWNACKECLFRAISNRMRPHRSVMLFLSERDEYDGGEPVVGDQACGRGPRLCPASNLEPVTRGMRVASFFLATEHVTGCATPAT